jgi:hypothetical protein
MPYSDPEEKKKHDREYSKDYYVRQKLAERERDQKIYGITEEEKLIEKREPSFPEHQPFGFKRPYSRDVNDILNPIPMRHGKADNPEPYGEVGREITKQNDQDILNSLYPKTEEEKQAERNPLQDAVDYQKMLITAQNSLATPEPQTTEQPQPTQQPNEQPQEQKPTSELDRIRKLINQ